MSYSNPSEAPSYTKIYERAGSNNYDTEPGSFNVSTAPSLSETAGTMRNNESQITVSFNEAFDEKGMSISDMKHGGGISANGESGFYQPDGPNSVGQAPGISEQGRPNYSHPDQGESYNNADETPAGISKHARPNNSESAQPSHDDDDSEDDDAGMSMVGKKYKEVNPTAYYVEK